MAKETINSETAIRRHIMKFENDGMLDVKLIGECQNYYNFSMARPLGVDDETGKMRYSFVIMREEKAV